MAGRPATGTPMGILIGMVVAMAVALIALVLLVVLWTNQEELRATAEKANHDKDHLMRRNEISGPYRAWSDRATNQSVAKLMNDEIVALAGLIVESDTPPEPGASSQIHAQLQRLWTRLVADALIEDPSAILEQPLETAMGALYEQYKGLHKSHQEAQNTIGELHGQIADLTEGNRQLKDKFDSTSEALKQTVDSIENERAEFRRKKEEMIRTLETDMTDQANAEIEGRQTLRDQIQTLNSELTKKQAKIRELQERVREFQILPQARMAARQADGRVLLAKAGEDAVFVDLGIEDHLTLGLRFAVYSPDTGVPSTGEAKAAIEVAKISDQVSQCQVVWSDPLNPILEGDWVANPIYDRSRRLNFYVLGEFDLDHDGLDDVHGREVIEAVINDTGGMVVEQLSSRIDFVIVGASPPVRSISEDASPEEEAIHQDQQERANLYAVGVEEALALSIPVLTQETFLNFLARKP